MQFFTVFEPRALLSRTLPLHLIHLIFSNCCYSRMRSLHVNFSDLNDSIKKESKQRKIICNNEAITPQLCASRYDQLCLTVYFILQMTSPLLQFGVVCMLISQINGKLCKEIKRGRCEILNQIVSGKVVYFILALL